VAAAIARRRRARHTAAAAAAGSEARSTAPSSAPAEHAEASLPSLIPHTLEQLEADEELQALHARVQQQGQAALTREEAKQRQRSLDALGVQPFAQVLQAAGVSPLVRKPTAIFQLNIGLYCNQACRHCHVESSPKRTEMMSQEVAERCVQLMEASASSISTVDITGGAPELMPQFRYVVREARRLGLQVIDRCNLTVLLEPGQEDTVQFLADHQVQVVASLPCYSAENVNKQRGGGVFERSIRALQMLNAAGYGQPASGLQLDLVYNPGGVFLAPPQSKLEPAYKQELWEHHGVTFNSLLCLNNMPIKRWADQLVKE
jgi:radical SAM/Cys-rich protein